MILRKCEQCGQHKAIRHFPKVKGFRSEKCTECATIKRTVVVKQFSGDVHMRGGYLWIGSTRFHSYLFLPDPIKVIERIVMRHIRGMSLIENARGIDFSHVTVTRVLRAMGYTFQHGGQHKAHKRLYAGVNYSRAWSHVDTPLAKALVKKRKEHRINKSKAAELCQIPVSTYRGMENGQMIVPQKYLSQVAMFLRINPKELSELSECSRQGERRSHRKRRDTTSNQEEAAWA